jgi:hypothetical protein
MVTHDPAVRVSGPAVVAALLVAGCGSAGGVAKNSATTTLASSIASTASSSVAPSTTSPPTSAPGESPDRRAYDLLEASLQAARFLTPPPPDYRNLTATALDERVAASTFGPIAQAGPNVIGYVAESASRVVFVVQLETGGSWACVAVDDAGEAISNPSFGHASTRDQIATYAGCVQHS